MHFLWFRLYLKPTLLANENLKKQITKEFFVPNQAHIM